MVINPALTTAFFKMGLGGRGLDDVWLGFAVAAFKKDKRT
jgi:hypothetical protein